MKKEIIKKASKLPKLSDAQMEEIFRKFNGRLSKVVDLEEWKNNQVQPEPTERMK